MIEYRNSVLQAHDFGTERPRVPTISAIVS